MYTIREREILLYTPKQMFDIVADVSKYHEFLPWCSEVTIISSSGLDFSEITQNGDKGDFIARLCLSFGLINQSFTTKDSLSKENDVFQVDIHLVKGPFSNLKSRWTFKPKDNNFCEIDFFIEFNVNNILIKKPLEIFLDKISKNMVNSFKLRANKVYG